MEQPKYSHQNIFSTTEAFNKKSVHLKQKSSKHSSAQQEKKDAQDFQSMVGIQAQNLYLLNYMNKLEFQLQDNLNLRKREKKIREKQLTKILNCLSERPNLCNDTKSLQYYLGITQGDNNGDVRENDSDNENGSDSDMEYMRKQIYSLRPKELEQRTDPLVQLLTPLQSTKSAKGQSGEYSANNQYFKSEKDLKSEFHKKEHQILEKYEISKSREDYVKKIEDVRDIINGGGKHDQKEEKQEMEEYLKDEWKGLARDASHLIGNFQD